MVSDKEVYNEFYKFRETEKFKELEEKSAKAFKELEKIQNELEKEYPLNENFTYTECIVETSLVLEKNKLSSTNPWLILLEINVPSIPPTTVYLVRNTENITFNSQEYTAFPFEIDVSNVMYGNKIGIVRYSGNDGEQEE